MTLAKSTAKPAAAGTDAPAPPPDPAAQPVHHDRVVIIPTNVYWVILALSLLFLLLTLGFYDTYLHWSSLPFYYANLALALILILWTGIGLSRRYRIIHNSVRATREASTAFADALRNQGEAHEGAVGRWVAKWTNRFQRLYKFIERVVKGLYRLVFRILYLPYRIVVWAYYTTEKLLLRSILILYDIVYYPLYAAWRVAWWAIRTSIRLAWWALGVVWKILRIPTKFPFVRTLWRERLRPPILAWWAVKVDNFEKWKRARLDKGRHHAELYGHDPDHWERDYKQRKAFPLPHPEAGRVLIRKRIEHVKAVQKARREGTEPPKWESPRAKLREQKREARKREKEEQLAEKKAREEEKKRAKEEKKAAKKAKKSEKKGDEPEADEESPKKETKEKGIKVVGKGKNAEA